MTSAICMGNLQRTNAYPGHGVRALHGLSWHYMAKGIIRFAPLLSQETIFFSDVGNTIYALNIQDGTECWKIPATWDSNGCHSFRSGALTNDTFYVFCEQVPEAVLCGLSLVDGRVVSCYASDAIEAALSFPTIVQDLLIGSNANWLCAFDLHRQELTWVVEGTFSDTPPALDEHLQRVYVSDIFVGNHHHGGLHAFDLRTGEKVWSVEEESHQMMLHPNPPLILEDRIYMVTLTDSGDELVICAFDTETGQETWRYAEQGLVPYSQLAASRGRLYYPRSSWEGRQTEVCALDIQSQQFLWTAPVDGAVPCAPVLTDDTLYAVTIQGTLYAFDLATGTPLWTFATRQTLEDSYDFQVCCSPWCIAEKRVFFGQLIWCMLYTNFWPPLVS